MVGLLSNIAKSDQIKIKYMYLGVNCVIVDSDLS